MQDFIGRKQELATLQRFLKKSTASLLVVRGRRRIGKSRLIEKFASPYKYYSFSGIAPTDKTTAQSERDEFSSQMNNQGFPKLKADDWNDLFWLLADKCQKGRVVILFDEISWMGSKDSNFLGKLKNVWDMHFKKNPQLILILCGSASSWIEKNILSSTGFVGRVSFALTLGELSLQDCNQFWIRSSKNISNIEKLKILSVTGGIPRYLEEINPQLTAEENIKNMCFTYGAILTEEFDRLFANVFLRNSENYKKIVESLSAGKKEFLEVCKALGLDSSGRVSEYLEELELSGFIRRDYSWHLQTGVDSKQSQYRLSDNYLIFYLRYIQKYKTKIERNIFEFKALSSLPEWECIMGLQFENLVLNNRRALWQRLGVSAEDIVSENPFFQNKTTKQAGCQIDYMIQTRVGSLYVCEIKFSKNIIGSNIVTEVQQKIDRLKRPKGLSCRSVLIHVNGVQSSVIDSGYFLDVIDFGDLSFGAPD